MTENPGAEREGVGTERSEHAGCEECGGRHAELPHPRIVKPRVAWALPVILGAVSMAEGSTAQQPQNPAQEKGDLTQEMRDEEEQ